MQHRVHVYGIIDAGANRGFAFVEFHSVDDARRWMEHNQV